MRRPLNPHEIQKVAEYLGFTLREVQSSHWQYKKDGVGKVTIPRYPEIGEDIFYVNLPINENHQKRVLEYSG